MKVVALLTDHSVIDRIIRHPRFAVVAEKPPPSHVCQQVALMAAGERADYLLSGFVF